MLAPNHPAPREQSRRGCWWPGCSSRAGWGSSVGSNKSLPSVNKFLVQVDLDQSANLPAASGSIYKLCIQAEGLGCTSLADYYLFFVFKS